MSSKIMVVDDEPGVREVLSEGLELADYTVIQAGSGNEALLLLEKHSVDLILSDVRMCNGDGLFLLKEIRTRHPAIPIVALITGFAELTKEQAQSLGAECLLNKPFKIDEIVATVQGLLKQRIEPK